MEEIKQKNAILIHGFEGHGDQGWFSETKNFLENNGYIVYNPDFPNTNKPSYTEWKKFFEENLLPKVNKDTLFVAHSLGPTFLVKYISENDLKIKTALFVSPAVRKNPDLPEIDEFFENLNLPRVKKSIDDIHIMYSNDPYIPQEDFKYLISELEAKNIHIDGKEHFTQNENSNLEAVSILNDIVSKKIKVVLMHGKDTDPSQKWYPWFANEMQKRNFDFIAPKLPNADNPHIDEWLAELDKLRIDNNTILVGHSRGGVAILRWLERQTDKKVKNVILLATNSGFIKKMAVPTETNYGFYTEDGYNFEKIRLCCSNFVVMHSRDDKWVPFDAGEENVKGLAAQFFTFDHYGHFGKDVDEIPELIQQITN